MKTLLYTLMLSMLCVSLSAQKVTIKDADSNVLMEVNDEGKSGSITLLPDLAPLSTKNKLYNISSDLYWDGTKLGTSLEAAGWKLTGSNIYPVNLSYEVGIGTNAPSRPLEVVFSSSVNNINPIALFRTSGTGNSVGALKVQNADNHFYTFGITQDPANAFAINYNSNISLGSDLLRLTPAGRLGIGVTDPQDELHVVGDGRIEDAGSPVLRFYDGATYGGYVGYVTSEMYLGSVQAGDLNLRTNNTDRMTIDPDGNVGIGTTSPVSLMHLEGNTTNPVTLTIHNTDNTGSEKLFFGTSNQSDAFIWAYGSSASSNAGKFRFLNNRTGANFDWVVDGGVKMKLANDGNLGIGVTSPTAKAHILQDLGGVDAFRVDDAVSDPSPFLIKSNGAIGVGTTLPMAKMHIIEESVNDAFRVDDAASDATPFVIKDDGSVGIGTASPGTKLHVDGYVTINEKLVAGDDNGLKFCTNEQTTRMVIKQDGKVGIGTAEPELQLQVAGSAKIDQNLYTRLISSDLTEDVNGDIGYAIGGFNGDEIAGVLARKSVNIVDGSLVFSSWGVRAISREPTSHNNVGIFAAASNGTNSNWAGYFEGDVHVTGNLSKGGGTFKIDHPLDPENKYLSHSFVESPDMMNVYNGNVTTNADGRAEVHLPHYFEALNKDFRYQLTVIGEFAQAIISKKISGNKFEIRTDKPNIEVSWQVTGIRQDAYANKNRVQVEEDKAAADRGTYLHPEAHGKPVEMREGYERMPN